MPNPYSYPADDEFSNIFIEAHDAALPASTLAQPGHPRLWELAAISAGIVAVVKAMTAASAPPVSPGAAV